MQRHDFPEFEVNKNGNNKKISVNVLPDNDMRKLGFTDRRKDYWCFTKPLLLAREGKQIQSDISFNFYINKVDQTDYLIEVLDENFLQPYDYQYMISKDYYPQSAYYVYQQVEDLMQFFSAMGIIEGHREGEYI